MNSPVSVAEQAARAAGRVIQEGSRRRLSVRHKGTVDLVTEIDLAAEDAIQEVLARETPGVPVLAEEGGGAWGATTRWIVDPLDGTTNFVHGFPSYGVSVALQTDGAITAGCVYDPLRDEAYTAALGLGAWCNGERLRVSEIDRLDDALVITGFPYDRRERAWEYLRYVAAFLERTHGVRRAGAASLDFAHIAAGRAEGYWEFGLKPWDVAAGTLLVAEAGGLVSDMARGPLDLEHPRLLASNGRIHEEMRTLLCLLLSSEGSLGGAVQT